MEFAATYVPLRAARRERVANRSLARTVATATQQTSIKHRIAIGESQRAQRAMTLTGDSGRRPSSTRTASSVAMRRTVAMDSSE